VERVGKAEAVRILALDLATQTGWAHSDGASGVQSFRPRRGDSPGVRYLALRAWLSRMYELAPFDLIVYEQPHHRGGHSTEVLVGMVTTMQAWAAEHGVETTARHSGEIKRHALGKGRGSKLAMQLMAEREFGFEVIDHNHADALWLLDLAKSELNERIDKGDRQTFQGSIGGNTG